MKKILLSLCVFGGLALATPANVNGCTESGNTSKKCEQTEVDYGNTGTTGADASNGDNGSNGSAGSSNDNEQSTETGNRNQENTNSDRNDNAFTDNGDYTSIADYSNLKNALTAVNSVELDPSYQGLSVGVGVAKNAGALGVMYGCGDYAANVKGYKSKDVSGVSAGLTVRF